MMKMCRALLWVAALASPLAMAGNVYRCESGDGITAYANKRVPGASCKLIGSYKAQRAVKPKSRVVHTPAPVPTQASAGTVGTPGPVSAAAPAAKTSTVAIKAGGGPRLVRGQVYAFTGKDGVRNYTSVRPRGVAAVRTIKYSYMETCYACGTRPGLDFRKLRLNTLAYQDEIRAAAREHGVEEAVIRAIIHAESAYNPMALSRVGAQGLMQLMPATARRFGVGDAFDPGQNIRGGVRYLAWLLKRFNGNLTLAAAGYNAGEGAVDKYKGVPPYSETQRYVQRVGVLAERYRGVINPIASTGTGGLSAR